MSKLIDRQCTVSVLCATEPLVRMARWYVNGVLDLSEPTTLTYDQMVDIFIAGALVAKNNPNFEFVD